MGMPHDKFRVNRPLCGGLFVVGQIVERKELQSKGQLREWEIADLIHDNDISAADRAQPIEATQQTPIGNLLDLSEHAAELVMNAPRIEGSKSNPLATTEQPNHPCEDTSSNMKADDLAVVDGNGTLTKRGMSALEIIEQSTPTITLNALGSFLQQYDAEYRSSDSNNIKVISALIYEGYVAHAPIAGNPLEFSGNLTYGARLELHKMHVRVARAMHTPVPQLPPDLIEPFQGIPREIHFGDPLYIKLPSMDSIRFLLACFERAVGGDHFDAEEVGNDLGWTFPNQSRELQEALAELIKLNAATQTDYDLTASLTKEGRKTALYIIRRGYGALPKLWTNPQTTLIFKAYKELGGGEILPFDTHEFARNTSYAEFKDSKRACVQLERRMIINMLDDRRAVFTHKGYECARSLIDLHQAETPSIWIKATDELPKDQKRVEAAKKAAETRRRNKEKQTRAPNRAASLPSPSPAAIPPINVNISPQFNQHQTTTVAPSERWSKRKRRWTFGSLTIAALLVSWGIVWSALTDAHKDKLKEWFRDAIPYLRATTHPTKNP